MPDLFGSATKINGHRYDLFNGKEIDDFRWMVAMFRDDGASQVIIKANASHLATYYPIRFNKQGEPTPLFRNYLFLEFQQYITINLCRSTTKFIKVITARDTETDLIHPVLVRRNAIDESLRLMTTGKFNEQAFVRPFYGKGSFITVIEGSFIDRKVRLEADVTPTMRGKVPISIDGIKAVIEIHKLAL